MFLLKLLARTTQSTQFRIFYTDLTKATLNYWSKNVAESLIRNSHRKGNKIKDRTTKRIARFQLFTYLKTFTIFLEKSLKRRTI